MHIDHLISQACERAGSSDFGPDGWQEPLEVLVSSVNNEAGLNEIGLAVTAEGFVGNLVTRLEIQKCFVANPEIADEVITRPVFGLGLPRTGSTALSYLLAQDDGHRSLRTWEAGAPVPPPETATQLTDPRIAEAAAGISFIKEMFPDYVGMLPASATGPQECLLLMALDFRSPMFEASAKLPSYSRYLAECDMTTTYQYHRRVLQLLQWHCPPTTWWLKTPSHMQHIDELDAVYPDALFIMTHREVSKVLPSVCALMSALSSPIAETPDPAYFGTLMSNTLEQNLKRLIAFRDAGREDRFFDIQFADLQKDPLAEVEGLYAFLGEPLRPQTRALMSQWWTENSLAPSADRSHTAADFGLDLDELASRFAFYADRFSLPAAR